MADDDEEKSMMKAPSINPSIQPSINSGCWVEGEERLDWARDGGREIEFSETNNFPEKRAAVFFLFP